VGLGVGQEDIHIYMHIHIYTYIHTHIKHVHVHICAPAAHEGFHEFGQAAVQQGRGHQGSWKGLTYSGKG
jgi:hypothetical protein